MPEPMTRREFVAAAATIGAVVVVAGAAGCTGGTSKAVVETPSTRYGGSSTMSKRILVGYATGTGSTVGVAEAIGETGAGVQVVTGVPHYPAWSVASDYRSGRRWHERLNGADVTRVRHHIPSVNGLRGRARMESSFLAAATPQVRRVHADAVIAVTPSVSALAAAIAGRKGRPSG